MDDDSPPQAPGARAQWERARRTWQLSVTCEPEALSESQRRTLFRALRVKRFERDACLARLPGPLRSGAFVDLEAVLDALEGAEIPARLERRHATGTPGKPQGA